MSFIKRKWGLNPSSPMRKPKQFHFDEYETAIECLLSRSNIKVRLFVSRSFITSSAVDRRESDHRHRKCCTTTLHIPKQQRIRYITKMKFIYPSWNTNFHSTCLYSLSCECQQWIWIIFSIQEERCIHYFRQIQW
jgi:hypothetical protein